MADGVTKDKAKMRKEALRRRKQRIKQIRQHNPEMTKKAKSTMQDGIRATESIWRELNACYPWIKIAIACTIILFVLWFWKIRHYNRPVVQVESRGFYTEMRLKPPKITKRNLTGKKLVALTFDDGPSLSTTTKLLDTLKKKNVPATFFVLGTMARNYPDIVRREVVEGHELASHTTYHQDLSKISVQQVKQDMDESCRILTDITGKCVEYVRPPYGAISENTKHGLARPLVIWSVDTNDWKFRDAKKIREEVRKSSFDGAVILMHDIYDTTVESVPMIIDDLRAEGYEFVTISEMAKARGVVMEKGGVYGIFRP